MGFHRILLYFFNTIYQKYENLKCLAWFQLKNQISEKYFICLPQCVIESVHFLLGHPVFDLMHARNLWWKTSESFFIVWYPICGPMFPFLVKTPTVHWHLMNISIISGIWPPPGWKARNLLLACGNSLMKSRISFLTMLFYAIPSF